ncbi:DDRGK domain-containing protein 1 isoform X1 [Cryptomeria japonica]|uniref:DDRGK domain-containing protein 1 isoform X1 n=1 Tax=Cryptomeria japonica TaxID=3369 RepID=UPI0025AC14A0|nr:DDRGK domain-containing protein 1 isoform X1 [Cryptomeria japonica]
MLVRMESESMLYLVVAVMGLVVALVALLLLRRRSSPQPQPHHHQDQVPVVNLPVRQPINRRMRRRTVASTSSAALNSEDEDDEEVQEAEYYASKSSKKKEMKRQEREARRQAEEGAHEVQRMKQDRYAEMRHRKDEEREAEERRKEEEAQAQKAKEEEATNAEFERWKDAFSVDTEGTAEEEMQRGGQGLLFDFVEYIKKHKCVLLEDLSAEFKLRTQDCINRIFALEKMGRLYGVMDDRGKYIYISLEEMKVVADYIKRQGRVSIAHLASKSNEFIALEPELDLDKVPMKLNEDYNVNSESNAITVT